MTLCSVTTFSDAAHFEHAIRAAESKIHAIAPGSFRAQLTKIDLNSLWLQAGIEILPRTAHFAIPEERAPIMFLADENEPAVQHSGHALTSESILFWGSGASHYHRAAKATRWATMSLTPSRLAEESLNLTGRPLTVPETSQILTPRHASSFARLRKLHSDARSLASRSPEILDIPEVARALEAALAHSMISCLTEVETPAADLTTRQHLAIMTRLEEFLVSNQSRALYLSDICQAVGASERTLRRCCQEHLGVGPNSYLMMRRLHLANRALRTADHRSQTVTEIAMAFGFWDLGRFAAAYRDLFGEMPRATLARAPTDPVAPSMGGLPHMAGIT